MINGELFRHHLQELDVLIRSYRALMEGKQGTELLTVAKAGNDALSDLVAQQRRALAYLAGEEIEPQVHYGEGVLIGTFGGNP